MGSAPRRLGKGLARGGLCVWRETSDYCTPVPSVVVAKRVSPLARLGGEEAVIAEGPSWWWAGAGPVLSAGLRRPRAARGARLPLSLSLSLIRCP